MVKGFVKDDILLLCSDGLTNMVTDEKIYQIISEWKEPKKVVKKLSLKIVII